MNQDLFYTPHANKYHDASNFEKSMVSVMRKAVEEESRKVVVYISDSELSDVTYADFLNMWLTGSLPLLNSKIHLKKLIAIAGKGRKQTKRQISYDKENKALGSWTRDDGSNEELEATVRRRVKQNVMFIVNLSSI